MLQCANRIDMAEGIRRKWPGHTSPRALAAERWLLLFSSSSAPCVSVEAAMQVTQLAACCALTLCASVALAQDKQAGGVELTSNTFRPERRQLRDEDLIKRLSLPTGFRVEIFARDLGRPRMLAVADDGTVYVSRRGTHDVVALAYQDGKAGSPKTVVEGIENIHGIALRGKQVLLASPTHIWAAERAS